MEQAIVQANRFDKRQIEIMRRTVARDTSPEEFALFLEVCKCGLSK